MKQKIGKERENIMNTEEIYQEIKEELQKNDNKIFLKEYIIPSINYQPSNQNIENMYFASGIEMKLERMMKQFDNKIFCSSYKQKYFFSNNRDKVSQRVIIEIDREVTKAFKEKLFAKVEKELEEFKQELKQKTPDEIIESAYELTVKKEIISQLKELNLDYEELNALVKEKNLLSQFYENWIHSDGQLGEVLSYGMMDEIELIVDEYNKEMQKKSRDAR